MWDKNNGGSGGGTQGPPGPEGPQGPPGPQGPIGPVGPGGGAAGVIRQVVAGSGPFYVDFNAKTITFPSMELWTPTVALTLAAGSKNFPNMSSTGSGLFYYVCYNNNTIELVSSAEIGDYLGYPIFAIKVKTVYSMAYPENLIGVRGGSILNRSDLAIGEWTLFGDSLTEGNSWWGFVREKFPIPIINNLAISGKNMSGANGAWSQIGSVPATTELCTIFLGTNDEKSGKSLGTIQAIGSTHDTNTFTGAYQTLIESLLTLNPKMRIILMTPSRAWTNISATVPRPGLITFGNRVKEIGETYNVPVVDMYNNMGYNEINQTTYLNDGLHYKEDGRKAVAKLVVGALRQYY